MNRSGFVEYVLDVLAPYGSIKEKPMFGGYGIYNCGIIFAIIIDDELYFKVDKSLAEEYSQAGSRPFSYQRENKVISMSYYIVPSEVLEDERLLEIWFNKTWFVAQQAPKKKAKLSN